MMEIRLSGSGGQGLLLAGIILAEAAIMEGKQAVQTQSYGPEARGGASKSEVIISDKDIDYPKVTTPDVVLTLTQEAYNKYASEIKPEGVLIADSKIVVDDNSAAVYTLQLPIIDSAVHVLHRPIVANMIALGALVEVTGVVGYANLQQAALARVPKGTEELNKLALQTGTKLVANINSNEEVV